jgi:hypothetical protein
MKKQLLWGMLLLMAGFSSCRKDSFKPVNDESSTGKNTKVNVVQHDYVDLVLQPRQPGATYDTYKCIFSGTEVTVTGSPSWSTVKYPTLINGVPAFSMGYSAIYPNTVSFYTSYDEDFFTLSIATVSVPNIQAMHDDIQKYNHAIDVWNAKNSVDPVFFPSNPYPLSYDYIKPTYTDANTGMVNVTGKLIRVTTGSHLALAPVDYPTPSIAPPALPGTYAYIKDDLYPSITYELLGAKGIYSSTGRILNTSTTVSVYATYSATSTPGVYHSVGTITRVDGSQFTFDNTEDFR